MQISFRLCWLKPTNTPRRAFKQFPAYELFSEYLRRISNFCPVNVLGDFSTEDFSKTGHKIWVCSTDRMASPLTSAELSTKLRRIRDSSVKNLHIVIGGPDGITRDSIALWQPDLLWNFGNLTFPHELAAIIASEQIYRAWTILKGLPYHECH